MSTVSIFSDREDIKHSMLHVDMSKCVFYNYQQKADFFISEQDFKIAIIEPIYTEASNFANELMNYSQCDLVIVTSMELNGSIYDAICKFDKPNYKFLINGVLNRPTMFAEVISDMIWFYSTGYFYNIENIDLLKTKLFPFRHKEYFFDVMYGMPRKHRSFVYNFINSIPESNLFYQTPYFQIGNQINKAYNFDNSDLWEDEIIPSSVKDYRCDYLGTEMQISQVIPFKIYSKTCYSLVTETSSDTSFDNRYSFFSEKTVKPILAHRLFILISSQWSLRNLRSLGFKTFDGIIDESYDEIEDNHQRWEAALVQAVWLCKQDCNDIFKKIIPIVTHNFEVLKNMSATTLSQVLERELLARGCHK